MEAEHKLIENDFDLTRRKAVQDERVQPKSDISRPYYLWDVQYMWRRRRTENFITSIATETKLSGYGD